jgi:hypothetical protein
MTRGRKPIIIDKSELEEQIREVEEKFYPKNRAELWKLVSETDWAKYHNYKPATLCNKAKQFEIKINTAKGLKGDITNIKNPGNRRKRLVVIENPEYWHQKYDKSLGEATVNKFLEGNHRAAMKIKCFDCSGNSKKNVSNCPITTCSLWHSRPWKKSSNDD